MAPWADLSQSLWRLGLPAVTLGTFFSGLVARIIRSSLLEVLDQDYVKAARAAASGGPRSSTSTRSPMPSSRW